MAQPTLKGVTEMAPYELILFSFLDSQGVEQQFTTADPVTAHAHATRHGLVVVRNRYEFITSEPVADYTGQRARIAEV